MELCSFAKMTDAQQCLYVAKQIWIATLVYRTALRQRRRHQRRSNFEIKIFLCPSVDVIVYFYIVYREVNYLFFLLKCYVICLKLFVQHVTCQKCHYLVILKNVFIKPCKTQSHTVHNYYFFLGLNDVLTKPRISQTHTSQTHKFAHRYTHIHFISFNYIIIVVHFVEVFSSWLHKISLIALTYCLYSDPCVYIHT